MKNIIFLLVIFLTGCAHQSDYPKPIFSDAEKSSRAEAFDEWFRKSSIR